MIYVKQKKVVVTQEESTVFYKDIRFWLVVGALSVLIFLTSATAY